MSKVLMISGHPDLSASVSNARIIEEFKKLCPDAEVRCLDKLYPDFKIDVKSEQDALREAEIIILQFPMYWYAIPALMKKWLEDVMTHGFALGAKGTALEGKKVFLSFTTGVAEAAYSHNGPMKYELNELLLPLRQSVAGCRMQLCDCVYSTAMMYVPGVSTAEDKKELEELSTEHARKLAQKVAAALK